MGFAKNGILGSLIGGGGTRTIVQQAPSGTSEGEADKLKVAEEKKKKALLALNQQGAGGQLTPPGGAQGQANTTKKLLLGL